MEQSRNTTPIANVRSGFIWVEVTQAEVDAAQADLDRYIPDSAYWDSWQGQEALAVIRAFRLAPTPFSYSPPLDEACGTCGRKHCHCSSGEHWSERFDVASGRRF